MESINIQIEPGKIYFSDGCVEDAGANETDLLKEEELKTVIDDSIIIFLFKCVIL